MELPNLGENCALGGCNRLDFLPIKCDACSAVFCIEHYQYDDHKCLKAKNRDNQVPVCPMCSEPVPSRRGELPDIAVSQHIDRYCSNNGLKKLNKPKSTLTSCSFKSCRQKDVIYLECDDCRLKFCIKHRHPSDHMCAKPGISDKTIAENWRNFKDSCSTSASLGFQLIKDRAQKMTKAGQATSNRTSVKNIQGDLNEQEALSIAIAESRNSASPPRPSKAVNSSRNQRQEEEDLALARAMHESQLESQSRPQVNNVLKESCVVS